MSMSRPPSLVVPAGICDDNDWQRRLQGRIEAAVRLPAPTVVCALLSESEMDAIFDYAQQMPKGAAGWVRYGSAHEALFLHHGYTMADGVWRTFPQAHPTLFAKLLSTVRSRAHAARLCSHSESLNVRCIEFHEYTPGGGLTDLGHTDQGSTLTFSVALTPSDEYEGGRFSTTDACGVRTHELERGEAIVFCSDMVHNVSTLESGTRHSLVVELWKGAPNARDRFG